MAKQEINKRFFFCYDEKLLNTLKNHGFYFITRASNTQNGNIFYLFERSGELNEIVDQWFNEIDVTNSFRVTFENP